jgi:hypothetical protein
LALAAILAIGIGACSVLFDSNLEAQRAAPSAGVGERAEPDVMQLRPMSGFSKDAEGQVRAPGQVRAQLRRPAAIGAQIGRLFTHHVGGVFFVVGAVVVQ